VVLFIVLCAVYSSVFSIYCGVSCGAECNVLSSAMCSMCCGAGEDRLHVMSPTTTKAASDPQLLPYLLKEGWWAMVMAKSQLPIVHLVHTFIH